MYPSSLPYFIFLAVILIIYVRLSTKWQNVLLLGASYFFYGVLDPRLLSLLAASTAVNFICALQIEKHTNRTGRKTYVVLAATASLGILAFFKYYDFFAESVNAVVASFGLNSDVHLLKLIFPVGLSFYTFQMLGYTFDVYRGEQKAVKNPVLFALFGAFFPTILSGPIERAPHLLTQLEAPRKINARQLQTALLLIMMGLVKKLLIADFLALRVDEIFAQPQGQTPGTLLEGVYFFSAQIYFDFSGYIDIIRGSARLFGFDVLENFQQPYLSRSVTEFWRRWHMSLSFWLRDYLYIPLGGNRKGRIRTYLNILITMLLCGLWHGANWTFVLWGGLHGIYLVIHRICLGVKLPSPSPNSFTAYLRKVLAMLLTFHLVSFTWIFFKSPTVSQALFYIRGMLSPEILLKFPLRTLLVLGAILAIDLPPYLSSDPLIVNKLPWYVKGPLYALVILLLGNLAGAWEAPFVYFAF